MPIGACCSVSRKRSSLSARRLRGLDPVGDVDERGQHHRAVVALDGERHRGHAEPHPAAVGTVHTHHRGGGLPGAGGDGAPGSAPGGTARRRGRSCASPLGWARRRRRRGRRSRSGGPRGRRAARRPTAWPRRCGPRGRGGRRPPASTGRRPSAPASRRTGRAREAPSDLASSPAIPHSRPAEATSVRRTNSTGLRMPRGRAERPPLRREPLGSAVERGPCPASTSSPRSTPRRSATRSTRRRESSPPGSTSRAPNSAHRARRSTRSDALEQRGPPHRPAPGARGEAGEAEGVAEGRSSTGRSRTPPAARCARSAKLDAGISSEKAKAVNKFIKELGLKGIQSQTQGEQIRVTGKKRDDLQAVIAGLKEDDFGIPLQFSNFRD